MAETPGAVEQFVDADRNWGPARSVLRNAIRDFARAHDADDRRLAEESARLRTAAELALKRMCERGWSQDADMDVRDKLRAALAAAQEPAAAAKEEE